MPVNSHPRCDPAGQLLCIGSEVSPKPLDSRLRGNDDVERMTVWRLVCRVAALFPQHLTINTTCVVPACAEVTPAPWIPAFAGMTMWSEWRCGG